MTRSFMISREMMIYKTTDAHSDYGFVDNAELQRNRFVSVIDEP